jgi:hypothetical protein
MSGYLIANLLPEATALDTQKSTLESFKTIPKNKLHSIILLPPRISDYHLTGFDERVKI